MPGLDLTDGQKAQRSLTLTEDHVRTFAEMTGDYNPLHFDEDFAAGTSFGRLVVQGGLTTGILHALVAMDMPGPGTVFLSQNWKFTAPVFIGDTITAEAEVLSVHETKPVCQLGVSVRRQDGTTVLEGEAWCYRFIPSVAGPTAQDESVQSDEREEDETPAGQPHSSVEASAAAAETRGSTIPASHEPDKSWPRIRLTLAGFFKKHGRWPKRLHAPEEYLGDLERQFDDEDLERFRAAVDVQPRPDTLKAEDDEGDTYIYGESLASRLTFPVPDPLPAWLTLRPSPDAGDSPHA
jgi:acyl dehydratase